MKHPLQEMMERRRNGEICGIPSYCSANELVLEQALRRVKELNAPTLIEATANQVNQFGGYTGMVPQDFYNMVMAMAEKMGVAPAETAYVGDSVTDMKTGLAAGMNTIGVSWGFTAREDLVAAGAHKIADTVDELQNILENL